MSIYGAIHNVLKHFETHLFVSEMPNDKVTILQSLRTIWHDIEKYSKNIYPEKTAELSHIVHHIPTEDLAITKKMYESAIPQFTRLKEAWSQEKDIKPFYSRLFRLLEELLLFNKDWEECCELCQGAMYYYVEKNRHIVLKQCRSCGNVYDADKNERLPVYHAYELRIALRSDLLNMLGPDEWI
ncbi:hypothetical protein [Paenibacillus ehimensis]|uniref:Uncharacterized protein n=1 Tax=Paenibacillus ehimensis TaxID=79264 RepID=A0ABT8V7T3_9BACL|nr:hypothetical protein [Paenibacillus ehimensis]MDO3676522.1 hypothetical protein [Paenibacillus ehimensis]